MHRYTIAFHSISTGTGLSYDTGETPADALRKGQLATSQGLRDVKIIDMTTSEALDPKAFAAKHRL